MKRGLTVLLMALMLAGALGFNFIPARAAEDSTSTIKEQIEDLNSEVKTKRSRVNELDGLISNYQKKIHEQETQQVSLQNEILILDNRVREKELRALRTKTEIETINLEVDALDTLLKRQEERIYKQKSLTALLVRRIHQADEISLLDVFLTRPSLSSFFDSLEKIKRLERNLGDSVGDLKTARTYLEETKNLRNTRRADLLKQEQQLQTDQQKIQEEQSVKLSLVSQTERNQQNFERMLYELRQEMQGVADDMARLEEQLKNKLDNVDQALARGDVLLNWPASPVRGITAIFHDPDYPFRNLFAHPGLDIRAPVGTPVRAAAGGYVAWNKKGSMYGNYLMLIHPGGIATVYAHLSKFAVGADTYVERGQIIGYSGGMPGQDGAGLSTGPHLHFEVRQGGIPINPENFLPSGGLAVSY